MTNDPANTEGQTIERDLSQARQDETRAKDPRQAQRDYAPHHTPHEQPVDPFLRRDR